MKSHPQKNTLLKNAQANAESNFFKRVFFSPTQEEIQIIFFPTLRFFNFFFQRTVRTLNFIALNLQNLMHDYLYTKMEKLEMIIPKKANSHKDPGEITFKDFFYMTGVDLVVTGTNISLGKPKYFSAAFTPDFSVVDVVSLSMSIPFLFRPYVIESEVNLDSNLPADYNKDYLGLYVDGGMLNNYPLHAFDYRPAKNINYQGDFANYFLASPNISLSATEFCDCILGIRLQNSVKEYEVSDDFKEGNSFIIRDFIGQLYSTILYPSEDGQIRSSLENNLSISIDVTDLELLDFSNPLINRKYRKLNALAEKQEKVIENAYKKIYENVQ